jgi:hypothetical protein
MGTKVIVFVRFIFLKYLHGYLPDAKNRMMPVGDEAISPLST